MTKCRRRLAFQFGNNPLGQHLAQFHSPLVEGIDLPDSALGERRVLVKDNQFAEYFRMSNARRESCLMAGCPGKHGAAPATPAVPSACTSDGVLPKASASACAKTLAMSMS